MKKMLENLKKAAADTFTEDIQMIDVDELYSSNDNIFEVNRVEELAETILGQGGVKENLIVIARDEGGYEIISGHRRTAAVRLLIEQGETISRFLPCLVNNYTDEDEKRLDIVLMNVSTRIISDAEMWKSYEVANEVLQNKKKLGEKFGKVRDNLAEILGVSKGKVAQMENIAHNADEETREAIKNGELSINTASEKLTQNKKGVRSDTFSESSSKAEKHLDNAVILSRDSDFINVRLRVKRNGLRLLKDPKAAHEALLNMYLKITDEDEIFVLRILEEFINSTELIK